MAAAQVPAPDLGPPVRGVRPLPAAATARTPPNASLADAARGREGSVVRTPDALRPFLAAFSPEALAPGDGARAHRSPAPGLSPLLPGGASPAALGGGGALAPSYRPSLTRRGGGVAASVADPAAPSAAAAVAAAAARLGLGAGPGTGGTGGALEAGTEALREWLAADVLTPLACALARASDDVASAAAAAGWPGLRLAPLAPPGGVGAAGDDDDAAAAGLKAALEARVGGCGPAGPPPALASLLEAVVRYARLASLLRGDDPRGLLPPCPRGYIAARIASLADGPCVGAFTWNGGGGWQGGPWTPELPCDAALLFHIVAAYVDAPRWEYGLGGPRAAPPGGAALFLGRVPSRPPRSYHALLSVRPPAPPSDGAAVVGLGLGTPTPSFALLTGGDAPPLTLGGASGLLTSLLLWFASASARDGGRSGAVGGRSLEFLGVGKALAGGAQGGRDANGGGWLSGAGRALWGGGW